MAIVSTSPKRVVDGESYHLGCWDRKVRQAETKEAPSRMRTLLESLLVVAAAFAVYSILVP